MDEDLPRLLVLLSHRRKSKHPLLVYSGLAQSVEHLTVNQGVVGPSPTTGAIFYFGNFLGSILITSTKIKSSIIYDKIYYRTI